MSHNKGFALVLTIIIIAIVSLISTAIWIFKIPLTPVRPPTSQSAQSETLPSQVKTKGFALPNFSKQELKNFSIKKDQVKTDSLPNLEQTKKKSKTGLLIKPAHAQTVEKIPVYLIKRTELPSDGALELSSKWGFSDEPTEKNIRGEFDYSLIWGKFPRGNSPDDPETQLFNAGKYDLFEVSLVSDPEGKYTGKAYSRSSLGWHKTVSDTELTPVSEVEAESIAIQFLRSKDLLPPGKLAAKVLTKEKHSARGRYDTGSDQIVYIHRTIDGFLIIDGGISYRPEVSRLAVALKGNQVIGLSYDEYNTQLNEAEGFLLEVKTPQQAYEELFDSKIMAGKVSRNTLEPSNYIEQEIDWSKNTVKNLSVIDLSFAYYRNENITDEPAGLYYQPIFIFKATGVASGENFQGEENIELIFYVPAVIPPKLSTEPTLELKTYTDQKHGYSFQYPANLYVQEAKEQEGIIISNTSLVNLTLSQFAVNQPNVYFSTAGVVSLTETASDMTAFERYRAQVIKSVGREVESNPIIVDNKKGEVILIEDSQQHAWHAALIQYGNKVFQMYLMSESTENNKQVFLSILQSVKFQ